MKITFCNTTALFLLRSPLFDQRSDTTRSALAPRGASAAIRSQKGTPFPRSSRPLHEQAAYPHAPTRPSGRITSSREVARLIREMATALSLPPDQPVHLIDHDRRRPRAHEGVVFHRWGVETPRRRLLLISDNIRLLGPELCLLDLARFASEIDVLMLAGEFCGTYALDPTCSAGFRTRDPLTTRRKIIQCAKENAGHAGSARLQAIAPLICERAASPMETALAILCRLSYQRGGLGLPAPLMNHRLDPGRRGRDIAEQGHYVCDLYWPEQRVALEYDSNAFHTGADRLNHDAHRRTGLQGIGVTVITVTRDQLFDPALFRRLDQALHRLLHVQRRPRCSDYDKRQRTLRRHVLGLDQPEGSLAHLIRFGW